jgi:hypothetical protein
MTTGTAIFIGPAPLGSWLRPGIGPPLEDLDLLGGPGAVAGHGAFLQPGEDVVYPILSSGSAEAGGRMSLLGS